MKNEHFNEQLMKAFVNTFLRDVNTLKALRTYKDTFFYIPFHSFLLIHLKINTFPQSVHCVHHSERSVHESVHKVFIKCSSMGCF